MQSRTYNRLDREWKGTLKFYDSHNILDWYLTFLYQKHDFAEDLPCTRMREVGVSAIEDDGANELNINDIPDGN